jgi:redox-sensitive bicupin YhaK (pirin superfamily)
MIQIRKSEKRGRTRLEWLDSRHSFSFGGYYDPAENGFSVLRVINEDRIAPARGFPTHPHRDMEIVTYVLSGTVEHRDSAGNHGRVAAGEVQLMRAGTGILHSEMNPSDVEQLHLLQIWILPRERGLRPGYEQKTLAARKTDEFVPIASPEGRSGGLIINQDATIYSGGIRRNEEVVREIARGRRAYLHIVRGRISLDGMPMGEGDGAKIAEESRLVFETHQDAELLLFDLPGSSLWQ